MYKKYLLDNGLTVLLVPNSTSQAVLVDAFVKTGSRNENERIQGISHFLEHLNFKGTNKYPTTKKINEVIDNIGGDLNANTSNEFTQFMALVPAKHIAKAFDVVTELTLYPTFKPVEIEREKGVIIEEINMYLDSPAKYAGFLLEEGMWNNHSFGRNVLGTPETIRAMTRVDIVEYRNQFYVPENIVLAIAGNFDEKVVKSLVDSYWRKIKSNGFSHSTVPASSAKQIPLIQQTRDTSQAHWGLGFRSYNINDPKNYALDIVSAILSGGMSSRLFIEIRERRGLAYYVQAGSHAYSDTGVTMVRAGVEKGKIGEALQATVKELNKLKKTAVSSIEMKKAKEFSKGRVALALEDTATKLDWYLEQISFKKSVEEPEQWFKKIDNVTPQDVKRAAQEILRPENATLSIVGPYNSKQGKELRSLVNNL